MERASPTGSRFRRNAPPSTHFRRPATNGAEDWVHFSKIVIAGSERDNHAGTRMHREGRAAGGAMPFPPSDRAGMPSSRAPFRRRYSSPRICTPVVTLDALRSADAKPAGPLKGGGVEDDTVEMEVGVRRRPGAVQEAARSEFSVRGRTEHPGSSSWKESRRGPSGNRAGGAGRFRPPPLSPGTMWPPRSSLVSRMRR